MKITRKVLTVILFIFIFLAINSFSSISVKDSKYLEAYVDITPLNQNEILISFLPLSIGEATLIQLPNNDFYLIDTGYTNSTEELSDILTQHGVQKLKGIFLTNACKEHIGGLDWILENYPVETIYVPNLISSSIHIPNRYRTKVVALKENDEIQLIAEVKIHVLGPSEPLSLSPQANSLVVQLIHKDIRFLFTSDINAEIEKRLIDKYDLKSEVLKVSDYGGNNSSIPEFLKEVDAQVGIIFSSDKDLYQLSDDVLERLNESWIDVYILKRYGEVQIISTGNDYQVDIIKIEE